MFPQTFERPKVVRLEQEHRLIHVRIGDLLMRQASSIIKSPAKSSREYAGRLSKACRTLLNAQTHYMEAGLGRMASVAAECRHGLRGIEARVRGDERQGGR